MSLNVNPGDLKYVSYCRGRILGKPYVCQQCYLHELIKLAGLRRHLLKPGRQGPVPRFPFSIMSRRYDSRTTTFSPEGRLFQVEYAMEAISHAGTALGILANDGVMLAAEKKITSKLLDQRQPHEKLFRISENLVCAVAGITSDANILIDYARLTCQRYMFNYHEHIPIEQLVQAICNLKQSYTQNGGMRPFGCSFIWAGWDKIHGYQLYQSDPSGNYGGWKATCVGANNSTAQSIFKTDYEESMDVEGAKKLLVKVLGKTSESASIVPEKLELIVLQKDPETGQMCINSYSTQDISTMVKQANAAAASS